MTNNTPSVLDPYRSIYRKLEQLIPNLKEHLEHGTAYGKSKSDGFMDMNFDYITKESENRHVIALAHYFEMNGDLVPDPDMRVRIITDKEIAEALSFQNQLFYQQVYERTEENKTVCNEHVRHELNEFLDMWLTNAIDQGHRFDLPDPQKKKDEEQLLKVLRDVKKEKENGLER